MLVASRARAGSAGALRDAAAHGAHRGRAFEPVVSRAARRVPTALGAADLRGAAAALLALRRRLPQVSGRRPAFPGTVTEDQSLTTKPPWAAVARSHPPARCRVSALLVSTGGLLTARQAFWLVAPLLRQRGS